MSRYLSIIRREISEKSEERVDQEGDSSLHSLNSQPKTPCDIGGCTYPAHYPLDAPRYCVERHKRLGLARDAGELLTPYARLIAQAERRELIGIVGFQGKDVDVNDAVLLARQWIITEKPLEDTDPYAPDALADWLNVLETISTALRSPDIMVDM